MQKNSTSLEQKHLDLCISRQQSEKEEDQEVLKLIYELIQEENLIVPQNIALIHRGEKYQRPEK